MQQGQLCYSFVQATNMLVDHIVVKKQEQLQLEKETNIKLT